MPLEASRGVAASNKYFGIKIIIGKTSGTTFEYIQFLGSTGIRSQYLPQNLKREKIGSCWYCGSLAEQNVCIDYASEDFCNEISGSS